MYDYVVQSNIKLVIFHAGDMAQWLRTLIFLAEGLGSVLSTHIVAYNLLQFQGIQFPNLIYTDTKHACGVHIPKAKHSYS